MVETLEQFVEAWEDEQREAHTRISLFNPNKTSKWTEGQKQHFVKVFYHTRGHFDRLLWTRLSYAPTAQDKIRILGYMAEEVGLRGLTASGNNGSVRSHEQLYGIFAEILGVPLTPELHQN